MAPGAHRLPPSWFSKIYQNIVVFLLKKSTQPRKKLDFCMKNGKPCYLCYDKQNRLVTRGWRLVTIFFFFLSLFVLFLFIFLLFPFISFIFFISCCLFYVFYPLYFFYLFSLYMKFLKSCIYTCLYDMFNGRGLFAERVSRAHKPEPAPP